MKTPEEMAIEYIKNVETARNPSITAMAFPQMQRAFLAGYKAAENHFRDATEKVTYDYVETASNEAKELIAKFGLIDNEEVLVKALVAAYCRGVDAVDGYLRNSLSAYRASVKQQQWISVKDRLPEVGKEILWYHEPGGEFSVGLLHHEVEQPFFTHWMPLPAPPKEEK